MHCTVPGSPCITMCHEVGMVPGYARGRPAVQCTHTPPYVYIHTAQSAGLRLLSPCADTLPPSTFSHRAQRVLPGVPAVPICCLSPSNRSTSLHILRVPPHLHRIRHLAPFMLLCPPEEQSTHAQQLTPRTAQARIRDPRNHRQQRRG